MAAVPPTIVSTFQEKRMGRTKISLPVRLQGLLPMASSVFSKLLLIKVWARGEFSALLIVSVFPQVLFSVHVFVICLLPICL